MILLTRHFSFLIRCLFVTGQSTDQLIECHYFSAYSRQQAPVHLASLPASLNLN